MLNGKASLSFLYNVSAWLCFLTFGHWVFHLPGDSVMFTLREPERFSCGSSRHLSWSLLFFVLYSDWTTSSHLLFSFVVTSFSCQKQCRHPCCYSTQWSEQEHAGEMGRTAALTKGTQGNMDHPTVLHKRFVNPLKSKCGQSNYFLNYHCI